MDVDKERQSDPDSLEGSDEDDENPAALGLETEAPEFYDPDADEKDERWMSKLRQGRRSDAILSCPLCLSTVCIDCQQHATYENQFRAMLVMNCRVETSQVVKPADRPQPTSKRRRSRQPQPEASDLQEDNEVVEQYNPVHCALCDTEVGLRELPPSGVYHLFNVIPSNA